MDWQNSVINGGKKCIDIQIYDVKQCFVALRLEDCMLDLCSSTPDALHKDKLALQNKFSGSEDPSWPYQ
jgi:hypothetical protein